MACYDPSVLNRRELIGRGIGFGLTLYASKLLTVDRVLEAAQAQALPEAPVIVSVFLPGGCDLLGVLQPMDQLGRLNDLRRSLPVGDDVARLAGESRLGFHPALADGVGGGIAGLFAAGKVGFLPGIDYADPDLSHFNSRHFWERGMVTHDTGPGWLGRWLDANGDADNPLQGLTMDSSLSPVLRTAAAPAAALDDAGDATLDFGGTWGTGAARAAEAWARLAALPRAGAGPVAAGRAARLTQDVGRLLAPYGRDEKSGADPLRGSVEYPDESFGRRLGQLAALLSLPLGVRVATIDAPGDYDTHDNQPEELDDALRRLSRGLSAFQADLEARGIADRVLTLVWSEFGRRPQSNESSGTDHGAGGLAWVQGTRARGGVLSEVPDLGRLDRDGNLAVTVDFRRVYCSLLEQWMGADAAAIIPDAGRVGRLAVVR
ncbi:MAG TPA: DUF1501 domain-containing protein [Capillimicrobium sp.]|nr:DUF1501 domain-containing protein [Capillimicrobium sp.]